MEALLTPQPVIDRSGQLLVFWRVVLTKEFRIHGEEPDSGGGGRESF